jgi:parallel beta-helix repeat protein
MRLPSTAILRKVAPPLALAALVLGAVAVPVSAVDYHVSPGGSDAGPGSAEAPWCTLQKAADAMGPGDVAVVADGAYAGFHSTRSGIAGKPITFRAESDHALITDRNADTPDCINIENHDWIVVDGFRIDGAPRVGIRVVEAADVVVRNNVITNCELDAILTGFAVRVHVIGNVCANSRREHGIYISNSHGPGDSPLISGNRCYGNGRSGIQFNGDCTSGGDGTIDDGIIENNVIYQNKTKGISLISARNVTVRNNIIFDNLGGAAGIHLTDEPDCGLPSVGVVVNNTIVESRIAAIRITDASANNRIFNNVIVGPERGKLIADEVGASKIDANSNIFRTSPRGLFINAEKWNFHLADRSPARGAGRVTFEGVAAPADDRDGKARADAGRIDAGAYEDSGQNGLGDLSATITVADLSGGGGGGGQVASADDSAPPTGVQAVAPETHQFAIKSTHPRLWLTPQRLAMLRRKECLDAQGNPIPGCQPDSEWRQVLSQLPSNYWGEEPWHYALAYVVNGDVAQANKAISLMDARVQTIDDSEDRGQSNFLRIANTMRGVGLVYDWCYDLLTETQKQNYRAYMNQLLDELWNPFNNPTHEWNGWAVEDPGNNFYYSFLAGTCYAGLAVPPTTTFYSFSMRASNSNRLRST